MYVLDMKAIYLMPFFSSHSQLDNSDEQAAAIRRELDARQEEINKMERVSGFEPWPSLLEVHNVKHLPYSIVHEYEVEIFSATFLEHEKYISEIKSASDL